MKNKTATANEANKRYNNSNSGAQQARHNRRKLNLPTKWKDSKKNLLKATIRNDVARKFCACQYRNIVNHKHEP